MKVTRVCQIRKVDDFSFEQLDQLMKVFCSAVRFAFNRLVEGKESGELIKQVSTLFHLNKRYSEDAVLQVQEIISSQQKLLPDRITNVQGKIKKNEQKIDDYETGKKTPKKVSIEVCLQGLQGRLAKLKQKEMDLVTCQKNGTIPKVIFGGRKNFYQRLKEKMTKEEWQDLRSNSLYARGDKSKKET